MLLYNIDIRLGLGSFTFLLFIVKYRSSLYDTLLCDLNSGELLIRSETKSCKFSFSSSNSFTSKHSTSLLNRFNSKYYHNPRVKINEINLLCPSKRGTWIL